MLTLVEPGTFWWYKNKQYVVRFVWQDRLSQDADTGEWTATVEYTTVSDSPYVFLRSLTEFERKFGLKS